MWGCAQECRYLGRPEAPLPPGCWALKTHRLKDILGSLVPCGWISPPISCPQNSLAMATPRHPGPPCCTSAAAQGSVLKTKFGCFCLVPPGQAFPTLSHPQSVPLHTPIRGGTAGAGRETKAQRQEGQVSGPHLTPQGPGAGLTPARGLKAGVRDPLLLRCWIPGCLLWAGSVPRVPPHLM